jgi:two-component system response regulator HydG
MTAEQAGPSGSEDFMAREESGFKGLIGQAPQMQRLWRSIARAATGRYSILLVGESGTGKNVIARTIHSMGLFPERPFVVVDCSVAPALVSGQLFGQAREELLCTSGTLFLDEVWALPPTLQAKLVRVLQERELRLSPRTNPGTSEVRILAGSTRDPESAIQQGTLRRDLYSRLSAVSLRIPALRDRREDIPALADHFLQKFAAVRGTRLGISPEAGQVLQSYHWPGNLRELKECMEYAGAACSGPALRIDDLPLHVQSAAPGVVAGDGFAGGRILPLAEVERQTILKALERMNGDKVMTARVLGIGKTTLYRKLKEYSAGGSMIGPVTD